MAIRIGALKTGPLGCVTFLIAGTKLYNIIYFINIISLFELIFAGYNSIKYKLLTNKNIPWFNRIKLSNEHKRILKKKFCLNRKLLIICDVDSLFKKI